MKFFDPETGNPINGAERFWIDGDFSPEWEDRCEAVSAELSDFDCNLITESLVKGWTVAETIAQGREDLAERDEEARLEAKHGDRSDFDMSMNY